MRYVSSLADSMNMIRIVVLSHRGRVCSLSSRISDTSIYVLLGSLQLWNLEFSNEQLWEKRFLS